MSLEYVHSIVFSHLRWARKRGMGIAECLAAIGHKGPAIGWDDVYGIYARAWLALSKEDRGELVPVVRRKLRGR